VQGEGATALSEGVRVRVNVGMEALVSGGGYPKGGGEMGLETKTIL